MTQEDTAVVTEKTRYAVRLVNGELLQCDSYESPEHKTQRAIVRTWITSSEEHAQKEADSINALMRLLGVPSMVGEAKVVTSKVTTVTAAFGE